MDVGELTLSPGETLAILGPNGSGKSTLLRVLGLLERPTTGRIAVHGTGVRYDRANLLRLRRRMATVFQAPLLCDTTVAANVGLGLRFRRLPADEISRRVETWLDRLGIGHLSHRAARTLSGGEAQRANLARAFALEPEILFLDEPFAGLDFRGREVLALELNGILRVSGIAAVLVTHNRHEAELLAERAAVMMGGRIVQQGRTSDVMGRPADLPLARFLGVENLIESHAAERDGVTGVEVADRFLPLRLSAPSGHAVFLAIRAEDVVLLPPGIDAGQEGVAFQAIVRAIAPAEAGFRVSLDAGFPIVARVEKRTIAAVAPKIGEPVTIAITPATAHVIRS